MSIAEINIDHVGPIEHLSIPIPDKGGVIVLHGSSGVGKTHGINAVRALHDNNARKALRPSDGMPAGRIEGLGVTVRLGRSNTAKGELLCESLDSGVDPSLLVDPGLKDPLAADSRRLATLVRLAGIKIDAAEWTSAIGDIPEVTIGDLVEDDPVVSADKIRRRLHEVALLKEKISESQGGEASTLLRSIADVDLNQSSSEVALAAELDKATSDLARMQQQKESAEHAVLAFREAEKKLADAEASALDHVECENGVRSQAIATQALSDAATQQSEAVQRLELSLADARRLLTEKCHAAEIGERKLIEARNLLDVAQSQRQQIEEMRGSLAQVLPAAPDQEAIEQATQAKLAALSAVQRGEVVRRAKATAARANQLSLEASETAELAAKLRTLARSTDSVLEQSLVDAGFDTIKVYEGRLCVETDRGLEPVSELSTGERWELALDLAARGLPKGAILSVQQEGWQALDQDLRRKVAAMAKQRGLVIVTAEVNSGELRAELVD